MNQMYGNKDEKKVALLEVFHHIVKTKFNEKRADMFDLSYIIV